MIPHLSDVEGICKIFIKRVHPEFMMYVSPINIDPANPVLPVVSPEEYGEELAENVGPFYTQGLPEDTKALSQGILSNREYLELAYQIIDERKNILDYELTKLGRQSNGLLFYYFSSLDQDTHMFWRTQDPQHPLYDKHLAEEFGGVLRSLYIEMDQVLGKVMNAFDINDPLFRLIVMSDHGFGPFRRQVNLNTWLYRKGYIALESPVEMTRDFFSDVAWEKTAAYALGINAIYLNLEGREMIGAVSSAQASGILQNIKRGLLRLIDPQNGKKVVSNVYIVPDKEKMLNPHAPDMIVGWNSGYRTSWESILGGFSREIIEDNMDRWSGDHCIDPDLVPALMLSNRDGENQQNLCDISTTILRDFGITRAG